MLVSSSFAQNSKSIELFPPNSKPFGLSYEDYIKNYWKLTMSMNTTINPWNDDPSDTGERCREGQKTINSPIFYLQTNGGGESVRKCTIPSGLGIFIPILIGEYSILELRKDNPTVTVENLPGAARKDQDGMHVYTLEIGDEKFDTMDLKKYGIVTSPFNLTFTKDNIFGTEPGNTTASADGYYVITKPLSNGTYAIHTHGVMCTSKFVCEQTAKDNFETDVKTTLIVK